jgi:hypothetical protein
MLQFQHGGLHGPLHGNVSALGHHVDGIGQNADQDLPQHGGVGLNGRCVFGGQVQVNARRFISGAISCRQSRITGEGCTYFRLQLWRLGHPHQFGNPAVGAVHRGGDVVAVLGCSRGRQVAPCSISADTRIEASGLRRLCATARASSTAVDSVWPRQLGLLVTHDAVGTGDRPVQRDKQAGCAGAQASHSWISASRIAALSCTGTLYSSMTPSTLRVCGSRIGM